MTALIAARSGRLWLRLRNHALTAATASANANDIAIRRCPLIGIAHGLCHDRTDPCGRSSRLAAPHAMDRRPGTMAANSGCPAFGESHEVADSESAERPADDGGDEMEAFVAFDESSRFILS